MADKHPYMSGSGGIVQLIAQLRKSFPPIVTAETLKKLAIAPNNETYVLNIFRFIGVLDAEYKKVPEAGAVFNQHNQQDFEEGFSKLVKAAYHELFDLHGENAWSLDVDKLISFFRNHDDTSDLVGKRQANTFQALAKAGGKIAETAPVPSTPKVPKAAKRAAQPKPDRKLRASAQVEIPGSPAGQAQEGSGAQKKDGEVALTVRIEINLPPGGDQATYDAIFKSIRENLINGNGI
ncbi:Uncharacterised protein [Bordetella ansorpii]|uniref:DUF5343 domain-containing protein n=1 Tax=Bordetella ansorpii TaxID=288768 RepID=A0A157SBY7_9BORD|nr:DUF5343 domain-containing protein [Bordetella ansorpii]SAI67426.1 Uncharacterised protein [Bordetella ansorpii]